jgi:acyl carrier protein
MSLIPDAYSLEEQIARAIKPALGRSLTSTEYSTPLRSLTGVRYDSATVLECVAILEESFSVTIDFVEDDLTRTFVSVTAMTELIKRKLDDKLALQADA